MQQCTNPDENFDYDKVGNRTTSYLSSSHTYKDINQLIQNDQFDYTYDADGNLSTKTDRSTLDTTTYTFDADNRLTRIDLPDTTIVTYAYDPKGRRTEKNIDGTVIRYIYDGEDILLELDGTNTIRAYYTHGPSIDEPLIMEKDTDSNGSLDQKVFYHVDGLGSIKTLTDTSGIVVQTYTYDSFGNIVAQTGAVINPYTYTGREFDSESGLYYYRARYYDASIGRFISEDPINLVSIQIDILNEHKTIQEISLETLLNHPQIIHPFQYAFNNPYRWSDPYGLIPRNNGAFWGCIIKYTFTGDTATVLATSFYTGLKVGALTHPLIGAGVAGFLSSAWAFHIATKCWKEAEGCPWRPAFQK